VADGLADCRFDGNRTFPSVAVLDKDKNGYFMAEKIQSTRNKHKYAPRRVLAQANSMRTAIAD